MLLLVDDIKFETEELFFGYVNAMFPDDEITDEDSLFKALTEGSPEIEFILSDYDKIEDEFKDFATRILHKLVDVKATNKNFKLTMIET